MLLREQIFNFDFAQLHMDFEKSLSIHAMSAYCSKKAKKICEKLIANNLRLIIEKV